MAKINTTNYQPVTSWNGTQDLLIVEQPDGTKVATPEQVKQYVEAGDFEVAGEVKDGHGNILKDMAKSAIIGDLSQTGLTGDSVSAQLGNVKGLIDGKVEIQNNAGFHNSIYRGKSLGTEVTQEQWDAISAGTFDDMYIGDYWTINSRVYRIAAFDYWLHHGNAECTTHHIILVPDANLYNAKMNSSNITTGGYVGSEMYTSNLVAAKTTIKGDFDAAHILSHKEYLVNAVTDSRPSGGAWYDSDIELMNEHMVYGKHFEPVSDGSNVPGVFTVDTSQLPLFALEHSCICNRETWWLRDVISSETFARVAGAGFCDYGTASDVRGVRPAFGIKA